MQPQQQEQQQQHQCGGGAGIAQEVDAGPTTDDTEALSHTSSTRSSSSSSSSSGPSEATDAPLLPDPDLLDCPFVLPDSLSAVPLSRSMQNDVFRMVGAPAPAGRVDLEQPATTLREGTLRILLHNAQRKTPRRQFPEGAVGTQQWEDAAAIALYTDKHAVYRIVNGYLSAPNVTLRDVLPVAPIVRRIYEAVQRIGVRYSGPGYRVLKACAKEGSKAMRSAYDNYEVNFAVGTPIDIQQFASFTKATSTVNDFAKQYTSRVIVLSCGVLDGFDISQYSMIPSEVQVLCLPPARFVVSSPPILIGTTVVVGVETLTAAGRRSRPCLQFASSLGAVPVVLSNEPNVSRDALLTDVEARLHNVRQRCVLYGPKGVGKTHLAHRIGQRWVAKEQHHVRWFSAGSSDTIRADHRAFVQACCGGALMPDASIEEHQPAMQRLIAATPNVLLVFDGVEDEAVVEAMLHGLLPASAPNVFVLITSSSSTICEGGAWAVLDGQHRKEVPVFTDAEVSSYLTAALAKRADAVRLQCTPVFQTHVNNHPKRLQWLSGLLRNKPYTTLEQLAQSIEANVARGSVDPVFTAVVDALVLHCRDKNTQGWEMLRLAATLADAPVPLELLRMILMLTDDATHEAIVSLTHFSLAVVTWFGGGAEEPTPYLVLHSLARDEASRYDAQYSVGSSTSTTPTASSIMDVLNQLFPTEGYHLAQYYYPHALHLMGRFTPSAASQPPSTHHTALCTLLAHMHHHMAYMGCYSIALDHALDALHFQCRRCPAQHRDIAVSLSNIGGYYSALGDQTQALKYGLEALEMRRTVLPAQHRDIAVSLSNIGGYYSALGDQTQALKYGLEALEMRRKMLPAQHRDIAVSLSNIGGYYSALGDQTQALKYGLEALEMQRHVLPEHHAHTALSLGSIGGYYSALGDQTQALKYGLEALEMRRKVLPAQHRDIAASLGDIGVLSNTSRSDRYESSRTVFFWNCDVVRPNSASLEILRELLPMDRTTIGSEHRRLSPERAVAFMSPETMAASDALEMLESTSFEVKIVPKSAGGPGSAMLNEIVKMLPSLTINLQRVPLPATCIVVIGGSADADLQGVAQQMEELGCTVRYLDSLP